MSDGTITLTDADLIKISDNMKLGMDTRNSLLQSNGSSDKIDCRTLPHVRYEKFVRRLNKLQPGRYMVILTVQGECDYTIMDLGKVEG